MSQLENDDTFAEQYVMFVHPRDNHCIRAVSLLQRGGFQNDVKVQNIRNIPSKFLPPFVNGVPLIADTATQRIYRGTECFNLIDSKNSNAVSSAERVAGGGGASMCEFASARPVLSGAEDVNTRFLSRDVDLERKLESVSSVEEYQKLRDQSVPRHANTAPMHSR